VGGGDWHQVGYGRGARREKGGWGGGLRGAQGAERAGAQALGALAALLRPESAGAPPPPFPFAPTHLPTVGARASPCASPPFPFAPTHLPTVRISLPFVQSLLARPSPPVQRNGSSVQKTAPASPWLALSERLSPFCPLLHPGLLSGRARGVRRARRWSRGGPGPRGDRGPRARAPRRRGYAPGRASPRAAAPPPVLRTKWTRRVPHPVLTGHAASLTPY
jgi:hypothetical protein